jgi:ABC-2 type transport system permease protein
MRSFFILLKKEVRELLTPQVILPLVAIMLVFAFIGKVVGQEQQRMETEISAAVMDLDQSQASDAVIRVFEQNGVLMRLMEEEGEEKFVETAREQNFKMALVIPEGFSEGLLRGEPQNLRVFTILKSFSFGANRISQNTAAAMAGVNELFSSQQIAIAFPGEDPSKLKYPVRPVDTVLVGDKSALINPSVIAGFIASQTTFIPIVLFLVIVFASQMITASIAMEKENKTLETLLSTPASRNAIVSAKLMGAGLVALLTSAIYMIGMRYYIAGLAGDIALNGGDGTVQEAASQLGLIMTGPDYLLLGLSLFFGILTALSIALILGSFAEDVKSAQGLLAPLMVLALLPYFLTMLLDISTISPALRWAIYAIPFSHPFLAAPNLLLDQYQPVILGIVYMAVLFVVFVFIASKIFSSDKILTMRLKLWKRKT